MLQFNDLSRMHLHLPEFLCIITIVNFLRYIIFISGKACIWLLFPHLSTAILPQLVLKVKEGQMEKEGLGEILDFFYP